MLFELFPRIPTWLRIGTAGSLFPFFIEMPAVVLWVFLKDYLARCMFHKFEPFFSILFPLTSFYLHVLKMGKHFCHILLIFCFWNEIKWLHNVHVLGLSTDVILGNRMNACLKLGNSASNLWEPVNQRVIRTKK